MIYDLCTFSFVFSALRNVRSLAVSAQVSSKSNGSEDAPPKDEPIKFSTSKASHKTWKVKRSMGSNYERPWWKVVPISLVCTAFLLWCAFRGETDIDKQLERQLYEQLPGLLSNEEQEEPAPALTGLAKTCIDAKF
uniref:Ubiquinol-cytochrome c reductase complex assembly factor 4 n=1 Tax=Oryzias melastigma TaxID=30732 RepID=A0A3B3CAC7_ORYME